MTSNQQTGSRAIPLLHRSGGDHRRTALRLRLGRRVGRRTGPRPVLPERRGLHLHVVDARLHRFERADRLRHRRCDLGLLASRFRAQTFAHRHGGGALLHLGRRFVAARERHPPLRRGFASRCWCRSTSTASSGGIGVGLASAVCPMYIAEISPGEDPRHARLVQPVRHHLRHAGRLFRQLSDPQPPRRHEASHPGRHDPDRLAADVSSPRLSRRAPSSC